MPLPDDQERSLACLVAADYSGPEHVFGTGQGLLIASRSMTRINNLSHVQQDKGHTFGNMCGMDNVISFRVNNRVIYSKAVHISGRMFRDTELLDYSSCHC